MSAGLQGAGLAQLLLQQHALAAFLVQKTCRA
jgi:hypothetical protein